MVPPDIFVAVAAARAYPTTSVEVDAQVAVEPLLNSICPAEPAMIKDVAPAAVWMGI